MVPLRAGTGRPPSGSCRRRLTLSRGCALMASSVVELAGLARLAARTPPPLLQPAIAQATQSSRTRASARVAGAVDVRSLTRCAASRRASAYATPPRSGRPRRGPLRAVQRRLDSSRRAAPRRRRGRRTAGSGCGSGSPTADRPGSADRPPAGSGAARARSAGRAAGSPRAAPACTGARGTLEDVGAPCADLDDPAEVHHGDPVGDVADDGEVVRDEQ